jgi:hypothetical protein
VAQEFGSAAKPLDAETLVSEAAIATNVSRMAPKIVNALERAFKKDPWLAPS